MEVNLIDYTRDAQAILRYTKATRLTLGKRLRESIFNENDIDKIKSELEYIANSIPSSWEFVHYTFEILNVSRAFTHQLVRTRTASFAQQALRVVDVRDFEIVLGPSYKGNEAAQKITQECVDKISETYGALIDAGIPVEDARGILPTNIATNILMSINLRALADMVMKRMANERVQAEYRAVVRRMLLEVLAVHPWAVKFLVPDPVEAKKELGELISEHMPDEKKMMAYKLIDRLGFGR